MSDALEVRELRPGEESAVLDAWREVFGRESPARDLDEWRWRFRSHAAPSRAFVAAREDRVIAHVAGLRSPTWIDGREQGFVQVVDAFVRSGERTGLKRPRAFLETMSAFLESCRLRRELVYGWPNGQHARLGAAVLRYDRVRTEILLGKELGAGTSTAPPTETVTAFDADARWLWERCASEWGASTIRDAAWLAWRYLDRPRSRYLVFGRRDANANLAALAVLAPPSFLGEGVWLLADWLVPSGESELGTELRARIEHEARARGAVALATLLPPWSAWFARFQEAGWRAHASALELHCKSFAPRLDALFLERSWWVQLGDSDLV